MGGELSFYVPRRVVIGAVLGAVVLFLVGLVLLSGSDGDSALSAGTATTLATVAPPAARDGTGTANRLWPPSSIGMIGGATTTAPLPPTSPPISAGAPASTDGALPPTTARRSPATSGGSPATTAGAPATTGGSGSPAPTAGAPPSTTVPAVTILQQSVTDGGSLAAQVVAAHNRERAARGLPALQRSSCLDSIADAWAAQLALVGRLIHNPGAGNATDSCMAWSRVGENIGYDGTIDDLEDAWMASAEHEENILDPGFTQVGVGVVSGPDGLLYVVVNFAG
jgi:uncharacterized protein YkwD